MLENICDLILQIEKSVVSDLVLYDYKKLRNKFPSNNSAARQSWKFGGRRGSDKSQAGLILSVNKYLLSTY